MKFSELLFPKKYGQYDLPLSYRTRTAVYTKINTSIHIEKIWYVFKYQDPVIKQFISDIKRGLEFDKIHEIKIIIDTVIAQLISSKISPSLDLIATVSSDRKRLNKRGFFVPDEIASTATNIFGIQYNSPELASLHKDIRKKQLLNIILLKDLTHITSLLLLDDVVTTGLTFTEHAKKIKQEYPRIKIYCLAFAGV